MSRALRLAVLSGAFVIGTPLFARADCGLNNYPPLSGYGYDSDRCRSAWQALDWARVVDSCARDAEDASADRNHFAGLTIAAQSWAKVAIGDDKLGRPEPAALARKKALDAIDAAIRGYRSEQPTADDESAQSAGSLRDYIAAADFYTPAGCAP